MSNPMMMLQTASGDLYCEMLAASSIVNQAYCEFHSIGYRVYKGVKRGYYDWQSTFNRIAMLDELVNEGFRGWVLYADADAFVRDHEFSVKTYLSNLPKAVSFVAAPGANTAKWDINAGVFLIDLGSEIGKSIVSRWKELFFLLVPDQHLAIVREPWGRLRNGDLIPNDQTLLQRIFRDDQSCLDSLWIEESLLNYSHGHFIAQYIRSGTPDRQQRSLLLKQACAESLRNSKSQNNDTLECIANTAGTDKGSIVGNAHSYTRYYSFLFEQFKYKPFNALEIGLLRGGPETGHDAGRDTVAVPSIDMWLKYFPFSVLYGIDISDFSKFQTQRFCFFQLDLSDLDAALKLRTRLPSMRFVVDDASHASFHQQVAFVAFFPLVEPGGYYIIEDCDWQPQHMETNLPKVELTRDIFRNWVNFGYLAVHQSISDKVDVSDHISEISDVFFHRKETGSNLVDVIKLIVIRKKDSAEIQGKDV